MSHPFSKEDLQRIKEERQRIKEEMQRMNSKELKKDLKQLLYGWLVLMLFFGLLYILL